MAVRVNKGSFNIREKLTELGRRFGLKGSEIMAAETVQDVRDLINSGRKNYIINGDFSVWQRGTSGGAGTGNRTYNSADRWFNYNAADTTSQLDLSSEKIGGVTGRFRYGMRVSGTQSSRILGQCIEGPLPAGDYIFSAWVKFSEIPQNFYMTHNSTALTGENNFAGWYGGSGTNTSYTRPDNANDVMGTGVWYHVYKKFTPVSPHLGLGIAFQPVFGASTTATMDIAGVQVERVESGTKPTNFEYRTYAEELALCQRYYYRIYNGTQRNNTRFAIGSAVSSGDLDFIFDLPVTMRDVPVIDIQAVSDYRTPAGPSGAITSFTNLDMAHATPNIACVRATKSGAFTTGTSYILSPTGSTADNDRYIGFSADI